MLPGAHVGCCVGVMHTEVLPKDMVYEEEINAELATNTATNKTYFRHSSL